jgi:hypothetical protein
MKPEFKIGYDEYKRSFGFEPEKTPASPGLESGKTGRKDRNLDSVYRNA